MIEEQFVETAKSWLSKEYDDKTRSEVRELLEKGGESLIEAFYKDLDFGTGGMRGLMGVGTNRINVYTIGKASQGMALALIESYPNQKISVAIAYDCRNNSPLFAKRVAEVLSANGIHAYLFSALRPTPELSFAVRELGCQGGVVITASHNPKEYNGFKVYGEDGGQIVSPFDQKLISNVRSLRADQVKSQPKTALIHFLGEEMDHAYIVKIKSLSLSPEDIFKQSQMPIVFTGIHGTGSVLVPKALKEYGFENVTTVVSQNEINGNFPTVQSPNPEEPEALALAIELAKKKRAVLVMGTDPDADRVGIAIPNKQREFVILNGNQTGSLIVNYLLFRWKEKGKINGNQFVASTIVTTDLIDSLARASGVKSYSTLTGFKHIGALIKEREGKETFIVGGEESYGYLVGDFVRDKDAVISCAIIAEMVAWAKSQGKDLFDLLMEMYRKHGFYFEELLSITKRGRTGAKDIAKMMQNLRNSPPEKILGEEVVERIDFLKESQTGLPASNVLQFITTKGTKVTARPSGTEPKIKFYFSVQGKIGQNAEFEKEREKMRKKIHQIKEEMKLVSVK
jgi:phosphoglucomutase